MEFKPVTWIMLIVLMALIIVPAFYLSKGPAYGGDPTDDELLTPPDVTPRPAANKARPAPQPKPPANQPKQPDDTVPVD